MGRNRTTTRLWRATAATQSAECNGTLVGAGFLMVAQLHTTGSVPGSPAGFPMFHVNPLNGPAPVLLFDSNATPFGPVGLPASGFPMSFLIGVNIPGMSVMTQGIALQSGTFETTKQEGLRHRPGPIIHM